LTCATYKGRFYAITYIEFLPECKTLLGIFLMPGSFDFFLDFYILWTEILLFGVVLSQRIILDNDCGHLRQRTKLSSDNFINQVAKFTAIFFLFVFQAHNWKLQLTFSFISKEKIDQNIVIFSLKSILDSRYLQNIWACHGQRINNFEYFQELVLWTRAFASHHVTYFESNQIYRL